MGNSKAASTEFTESNKALARGLVTQATSEILVPTTKPECNYNLVEIVPDNIPTMLQGGSFGVWRKGKLKKNGKYSKAPYSSKRDVGLIKVNEPDSWGSFDDAVQAYNSERLNLGIGYLSSSAVDVSCVDLDDCIDPITGEINKDAREVVDLLNSYTEVSTSGTGLHVFVKCDSSPNIVQAADKGFEYLGGHGGKAGYVAVTGILPQWQSEPLPINTVDAGIVEQVYEIICGVVAQASSTKVHNTGVAKLGDELSKAIIQQDDVAGGDFPESTLFDVKRALSFLPVDRLADYSNWLDEGMCLYDFDSGDVGLNLWIERSALDDKFDLGECEKKWDSFGGRVGGLTVNTLFYWAREYGYSTGCELAENFIYVRAGNLGIFINRDDKRMFTPYQFDMEYGHEYKGGKGNKPKASVAMGRLMPSVVAGDGGLVSVDELGWLPCDDAVIQVGGKTCANIYNGLATEPVKGDVSMWLELCHHVWGEHTELVLDHMAFTLQRPLDKIRWQILFVGDHRTGKSMAIKPLIDIFGGAGGVVKNENKGWQDDVIAKKAVAYNEVWKPKNKAFFESIKESLSDDGDTWFNPKGREQIFQANLMSMYMISNHDNALSFDIGENKLLVIRTVPASKAWSAQKFNELGALLDKKNLASGKSMLPAIHYYLTNRDVSSFSYGKLPVVTDEARNMAELAKPDYIADVRDLIAMDEYPFNRGVAVNGEIKIAIRSLGGGSMAGVDVDMVMAENDWVMYRGKYKATNHKTPRFYTDADLSNLDGTEVYDWYYEQIGETPKHLR